MHPEASLPSKPALIECQDLPFLEDVNITGGHTQMVARTLQGGGGPGGCDTSHWQDCLLRYGAHSERLRDAVASLARSLANTMLSWETLSALMAGHLIALDKYPGVRPIGVGETLRRILAKAVIMVTRSDTEDVCGVDQLSAVVKAGMEGAIHPMWEMFDKNSDNG